MLTYSFNDTDNVNSKKSLEYYYKTYARIMYAAAYGVVNNTHDAQDAVQSAFLGLSRNMDVLARSAEEQCKYYCLKAARNAALDIVRKQKKEGTTLSFEELSGIADPRNLEELIDAAEYSDVLKAVKNLGETYGDVLYMHYVMDMSVKQIADALGRKASTVKKQLTRGKIMLSKELSRR